MFTRLAPGSCGFSRPQHPCTAQPRGQQASPLMHTQHSTARYTARTPVRASAGLATGPVATGGGGGGGGAGMSGSRATDDMRVPVLCLLDTDLQPQSFWSREPEWYCKMVMMTAGSIAATGVAFLALIRVFGDIYVSSNHKGDKQLLVCEDISNLRTELKDVRTDVKGAVQKLEDQVHKDFSDVRTELKDVRTDVKGAVQKLEDQVKHMGTRSVIGHIATGVLGVVILLMKKG